MEEKYQVAILTTGNEIKNGDILNTNSQQIAQQLLSYGINPGTHITTSDNICEIESAIKYLISNHKALIITGGLGPTSDDLTRNALAKVTNKKLIFDETYWNNLVQLIKSLGYKTVPETNKQQAYFPEGASIILNKTGTASGCHIEYEDKQFFMLPGPPRECLPMVEHKVIDILLSKNFQKNMFVEKWLLFGVSEGHISEVLDNTAKPFDCETGYRICYPYIEFKIYSKNEKDFLKLKDNIYTHIKPYLILDGKMAASQILQKAINSLTLKISISDNATGGLLQSTIETPNNHNKINFNTEPSNNFHIDISGLNDFWENKPTNFTLLNIKITTNTKKYDFSTQIPFRGMRVKLYAVELTCKIIYEKLIELRLL